MFPSEEASKSNTSSTTQLVTIKTLGKHEDVPLCKSPLIVLKVLLILNTLEDLVKEHGAPMCGFRN